MRRLAALVIATLTLAGCGARDDRAPFVDSRIPPGLETRFYPPQGWAWGLIQVGDAPPARYGVSAPAGVARGQVLILPDYGEPAEAWFETAGDLNRRGLVVWVLEAAGQGGSGRYLKRRDLGHSPAFAPDVAAVQVMAQRVVRHRPLTVVAGGAAAPIALSALEGGVPADALVLVSPRFGLPPSAKARWLRRLGLGGLRAGGGAWSREGPNDRLRGLTTDMARGAIRLAWQTANPDLRMGGPSWSWLLAFEETSADARAGLGRVAVPVVVTVPGAKSAEARALCRQVRACRGRAFAGGPALHLEGESARAAWLEAVASAAAAPKR